ncbi:toxin glutamine deamidase domain-containing protein [Nocardia cyriacigeorgica]|uniref:toxin glutamine deamidase domain-containing protein n=1 Tax=Nocardia cyriacigeorgica TaxID=135487 RepID=UPI00245743FA|nr:toxin glutamine deamidase domain-containing protein [Nocardia cyriacigeorgica]
MAAALAAAATGVGAPAGAAAGAAARVATQAAIRLTMKQLLQRILSRVVKEAALGALEEGGLDLGIRLLQAAKGDRELSRDDFTSVWQSAAGGAIGGALSGGLGRDGGLTNGVGDNAGEGLSNALGNRAKQFATDYTTEVASDVGSQAAMAAITGEEFELTADTFTSAAAGAAQNQFDRGGNDNDGDNADGDDGPDNNDDGPDNNDNNDDGPDNNDDESGNNDRGGNDDSSGGDRNEDDNSSGGGNDDQPNNNPQSNNPDRGNNQNPDNNADNDGNRPENNPTDRSGNNPPNTTNNDQPGQTTPANANSNNDSGNGNEPPARTQPTPTSDPNTSANNNPTQPASAGDPTNTSAGNPTQPASTSDPNNTPTSAENNSNEPPTHTAPADHDSGNNHNDDSQNSNNPPTDEPPQPTPTTDTAGNTNGDNNSGGNNPPADRPQPTAPTSDEPTTTGSDNDNAADSPVRPDPQPSSLDLPTQDPTSPSTPTTPPQQAPTEPGNATQPNPGSSNGAQPTSPTTPPAPSAPTSPTSPAESAHSRPSPTTTPDSPSATQPGQSTPTPANQQPRPGDLPAQDAPVGSLDLPDQDSPNTSPDQARSPLDLPPQEPAPTQEPSPLDLPPQEPAPTREPSPLDLPDQEPTPTQQPSPLDLPNQNPAPNRTSDPLDLPAQDAPPTQTPHPLDLPPQDAPVEQQPSPLDPPNQDAPSEHPSSPLDLPAPNSPTDTESQSTTGAPLPNAAPANTTAAAATATAPPLDAGTQPSSPASPATAAPTSTTPPQPQNPTPTTQPGLAPQTTPTSGRTPTRTNNTERPTTPDAITGRPTTGTTQVTDAAHPPQSHPNPTTNRPAATPRTDSSPPPNRPGYDPTIHKYVAHFNDGRPIPRDPFYTGQYNPHTGRYQPTEAEYQAERAHLAANPPTATTPSQQPSTSTADPTRPDTGATNGTEPTSPAHNGANDSVPSANDDAPTTDTPTNSTPAAAPLHDFTNPEAHRARTQLPSWWPNPARDQANNPTDTSPRSPGPFTTNRPNPTFPDARAPGSASPPRPTRNESPSTPPQDRLNPITPARPTESDHTSTRTTDPRSATPSHSRGDLGSHYQGRPTHPGHGAPESTTPATHSNVNQAPTRSSQPNPNATPHSTNPQRAHTPDQPRDTPRPDPGRTRNPDANSPGTQPHSPRHPATPAPQTPAEQARAVRQFYRNQPPVDGRVTSVPSNHTGRPAYEIRRHRLPSGEHVSVLTVRVHLTPGSNISSADMQRLMANTEYAIDHSFNTAPQLLGGDRLLVDVEFTSNPADAHLQAGSSRGIGDFNNWSLHDNPTHLADNIRIQLGLAPTGDSSIGLTTGELRQLSNEIAIARAGFNFENPSDTRIEGPQRLSRVENSSYQHDVEDALRNGSDFTVGADPRTHPYGRLINDGGPTVQGRGNNCLDCSLSALSSFYGNPQVSAPRYPDELPDGTIDDDGEHDGDRRARTWLNSDWQRFDSSMSIAEQAAAIHDHIARLGPGSSALIGNDWHALDADDNPMFDEDGRPIAEGGHVTVIVYPYGASGPVWWDPQTGATFDVPPAALIDESCLLEFIPIGPGGPNDAGIAPNTGTSSAIPGSGTRDDSNILGSPDRVRMGVPSNPDAGGTSSGQGARPGELRRQQGDRSDHSSHQPASADDRAAIRRSDSDGTTSPRTPGVPTDMASARRPDSGDSRRDPVPSPDRVADPTTHGTTGTTPSHDQQTQPPTPHEHPGNPSHMHPSDGMGGSPQPQERDLAPDRDLRVLDDSHRPETAPQNAQSLAAPSDQNTAGASRSSDQTTSQDRNSTTGPSGTPPAAPAGRPGSSASDSTPTDPSQPSTAADHMDLVPRRPLDEVRPFEQPGGLRPVEPEFQQAVENAVPRGPDGEPLVHPPVSHPWVDEVNDGGPWADSGRGINCVDATRAGLSTFYGEPHAAAARMLETDEFGRPDWAGEIDGISNMEEWAGARYSHAGSGDDGLDEAIQQVADAGPGSTAAVLVEWAPSDPPQIDPYTGQPSDPGSHQLALINDNGRLLWVDFQSRTITDYFPFTAPVGDVWAITMDPDRNPVVDPEHNYSDAPDDPPEGPPKQPGDSPADDHPDAADPAADSRPTQPLLSPEEYLSQAHVVEALDRADGQGTTIVVDGVETPIGQAVRHLLPQHPELAVLLQETGYLENSLLARPKTLASLMNHPESIPVLVDAAHEVRDRGPDEILTEHESASGPEPTPLTSTQRAISELLRTATEDYLETDRRQPDFDVNRQGDPDYRRQYLDRQYQHWQSTQDSLNNVVREVSRETDGQPGWRNEPKDRSRAEDKIAGYGGNVSRLTDLVGAKIVFNSVADIYRAADLLASDERIEIVDFDDRFSEPVGSGYRDLQMKVRMPDGHIAELRLHLSHIDEVADYEHALYEGRRDLKSLAESEGRQLTPNESALNAALERRSIEMFQTALERGLQ